MNLQSPEVKVNVRPWELGLTPYQILESLHYLGYYSGVAIDPADLLRQRGIQVTAQRLAVLRAVSGHPHVTADVVAESVRTEIGAISLQAVYDALSVLVAEGLIRRIQPAGSSARFENRVGDNHHHLICRTCGRMVDVDCAVGFAPCLAAVNPRGYEIDEAEVVYWGRCPDCLGRPKTQVRLTASAKATAVKKPDMTQVLTRSRPRTAKKISRTK